jgi:hypothetical protein
MAEKGFLSELIGGDYGLAKTFWVYGFLIRWALNFIFLLIARSSGSVGFISIAVILITTYEILLLFGIWNSAKKYNGPSIWAIFAKILVVVGFLTSLFGIMSFIGMYSS